MYVIADSWSAAVEKWTERIREELPGAEEEEIGPPDGIQFLAHCDGEFPEVLL